MSHGMKGMTVSNFVLPTMGVAWRVPMPCNNQLPPCRFVVRSQDDNDDVFFFGLSALEWSQWLTDRRKNTTDTNASCGGTFPPIKMLATSFHLEFNSKQQQQPHRCHNHLLSSCQSCHPVLMELKLSNEWTTVPTTTGGWPHHK
jgi:hypothetical protein